MSKVLDLRIKNDNFVYGTDKKGYNQIPEMYVSLFNSYLETVVDTEMDKELDKRDQRIKVLERALELACDNVDCWKFNVDREFLEERFIQQAEEELDYD